MPTQAQQIDLMLAENRELYDYFQNHKAFWEADLATKKLLIDSYIVGARDKSPFLRLSKNQVMNGDGSLPDYFSSGEDAIYTKEQIVTSKPWGERTYLEKELLTKMGRANTHHLSNTFNIWRCDWTSKAQHAHLFYFPFASISQSITQAMMVKIISGSIRSYGASGTDNASPDWQLCGENIAHLALGYRQFHPIRSSGTGSFFFALPASVTGDVPLNPENWGFFPYIGDNQND